MCQSTVYMRKGTQEEVLLRDAILVEPGPGWVKIQGLFEPPQTVAARIVTIDLLKHRIILEARE